jgi:glycosyltransferase involved in cell wall biosynthesis
LAIEALARINTLTNTARLVFIGEAAFDGADYARRLERRAAELGVEHLITFLGYRDDVRDLMAAADVVVHTSVFPEPLGLTPIEAQACGVPVVASAHGGTLETVLHRGSGYLFAPGSVDDLVAGITWSLTADRAAVAAAGVSNVRTRFNITDVVNRYLAIYDELA